MPTVAFLPLAVNPADYPAARLSMLPTVPRMKWPTPPRPRISSAFLDNSEFFVYGRYALVEALKRCGAGPGKAVLLPAYHCRTIVESALHLGAEVRFYPMTSDLQPECKSMLPLVVDGHVCAMVMTHYFGFANALESAAAFCVEHGINLIEDCAHAFYGEHRGQALGLVGHYAIASAWKFLPVRDGAMLRDNSLSRPRGRLRRQGLVGEAKAVAAWARACCAARRKKPTLPDLDGPSLMAGALEIHAAARCGRVGEITEFQPREVAKAGLRTSHFLVMHAPHDEVTAARRGNYARWLEGVQDLAGVVPLFPVLPEGCVPYAFPLLTDKEGLIFHALKLAGIPIWRWEDVAQTNCPVAQEYRLRLLQLPCHQDLSESEIDWMLKTLKNVLAALPESESIKRKMRM